MNGVSRIHPVLSYVPVRKPVQQCPAGRMVLPVSGTGAVARTVVSAPAAVAARAAPFPTGLRLPMCALAGVTILRFGPLRDLQPPGVTRGARDGGSRLDWSYDAPFRRHLEGIAPAGGPEFAVDGPFVRLDRVHGNKKGLGNFGCGHDGTHVCEDFAFPLGEAPP
jgi:hypothetical protein